MDKGFHSAANQAGLKDIVDVVVMPKKGRLSAVERTRQSDPEFVTLRQRHSAVESAINALESHGLDLCRDHGIVGFKPSASRRIKSTSPPRARGPAATR